MYRVFAGISTVPDYFWEYLLYPNRCENAYSTEYLLKYLLYQNICGNIYCTKLGDLHGFTETDNRIIK